MTHEVIDLGLYVIFGIVLLPVYVMVIGWFVGRPREFRPIALAVGYMIVFLGAILIGIVALDTVLSLVT